MKSNQKITILLILILVFVLSLQAIADGGGDDNAAPGDGGTRGKVDGKGYYKSSEWMYKVSIYVGKSDNVNENSSLGSGFYEISTNSLYIKPRSFALPNGVIFGRYNKPEYLRGNGLSLTNSANVITGNAPPPPITNGGKISTVKSYFGDTNTLIGLIDASAQQRGTTMEGLVSNLQFTIDGEKGIKDPKEILPLKGENGKYTNKVPWVIIYEPVTIAHLKDGKTKLAFTATEYALAQKSGLYDFFYTGEDAQFIAGMTHANLPNSIVLEKSWFGYTAYPPLPAKTKWSNDRIIKGGGWGQRILYPNTRPKEPIEPPEDTDDGDYRVDTDVITSFWIYTDERITPDAPTTVIFYVDGREVENMYVVLPEGGSQLVWAKWHTPLEPVTITVTAEILGNGYFNNGGKSISRSFKIVDLNESIPPDPRAKDPETGKPVQKPTGWKIPNVPIKSEKISATWGTWSAYWEEDWVWYEDWYWSEENGWEDFGEWIDEGDWEYFWNNYYATLNSKYSIKPDDMVPTAKQFFNRWEMKSGYGINIEVESRVSTDGPGSAVATQGNVINYFPEFNYANYWRLSDRINGGKFELRQNEYSPNKRRVHYTPLWFPDGARYTPYSELIDIWTPAGMLSIGLDDYIDIDGNLWDDWRVVPRKVD